MVKGISRQVIVVDSPDPRLFEQAIFILKDDALGEGITDDQLLKEAQQVIRGSGRSQKRRASMHGALWAFAGAAVTGGVWVLTLFL